MAVMDPNDEVAGLLGRNLGPGDRLVGTRGGKRFTSGPCRSLVALINPSHHGEQFEEHISMISIQANRAGPFGSASSG